MIINFFAAWGEMAAGQEAGLARICGGERCDRVSLKAPSTAPLA